MSAGVPTDSAPPIIVEELGSLAVIRFNRPHKRNPLSTPTLKEIDRTFTELAARVDISTIVFTGTDDVFASGADIRELQTLTPATAREFSERGQRLFQMIADARQLTIAAVNGYCMGGALDLALACDIRIASPTATFAHPGANLGIITGWGGTQRLTRLVGPTRALGMFFTARRVNADEALAIGLVDFVADSVLELARELTLKQTEKKAPGTSPGA